MKIIDSPWSQANIAPGSTNTSEREIGALAQQLANSSKKRLIPLLKRGSGLEVFTENPRIIVSTIPTESAAVWIALYDGTLLNLLADRQDKERIEQLLHDLIGRSGLPVIPILHQASQSKPKYKFKGISTRVYSLHGGANLRTFLELDIYDPFKTKEFAKTYKSLASYLQTSGIMIPAELPPSEDKLTVCEQLPEVVKSAKQQLSQLAEPNPQLKTVVMKLELYAKLFSILIVLDFLNVSHFHPHGGNWVITWSVESLTQSQLETELISPKVIDSDFQAALEQYPLRCNFNPLLIDFDLAYMGSPATRVYDQEKLVCLLSDPDPIKQTIAIQLLLPENWPDSFISSLFSNNNRLLDLVIKKISLLILDAQLDSVFISKFLLLFTRLNLEPTNPVMCRLITALLPKHLTIESNIRLWEMWLQVFRAHPKLAVFKKTVIEETANFAGYPGKETMFLQILESYFEPKGNRQTALRQKVVNWLRGRRNPIQEVFGGIFKDGPSMKR